MRPEMSLQETLNAIYTEPGRVFESLRERPRFLVAALLTLAMGPAFQVALILTYGYNNVMRSLSGTNAADIGREQNDIRTFLWVQIVLLIVGSLISFAIGSTLYYLAVRKIDPDILYEQILAVWAYSTLPPAAIASLLNVAILVLRPPPSGAVAAEALTLHGGLIQMYFNSLFVDTVAHPVFATALHSFDPFNLYGIVLASFGLQRVCKISAAKAWSVVLAVWLVHLLFGAIIAGQLNVVT
jgi:Yip1 domain